ncbi:MBL fold metallo-hydrolase [Pseudosulfitobacter sp. DSM 107133]|uniref:MBL fold metallo-hydrolase n=1 Tax=Pseudosulfitobacter sp. DSM 107133 TaxID=2883100 RepID=UPI000DF27553|nr:MBL fold metallo-hydrolase [Pseudosulfitobacter sp. DSM 107133]
MIPRRTFLASSAAAITFLPYAARAAAHAGDRFSTDTGDITVFPVDHASFVMTTPAGTIYNDPIGDPANYADFPAADLILVTHEHGDHYNAETLAALMGENTVLVVNPAVAALLPEDLAGRATVLANGEQAMAGDVSINAIPAYNTTEERKNFHPEGRDNGYVLTIDGFRTYISGDTEGTREMKALSDIDLAFVCMNLPFTMDSDAAAEAVAAFKPTHVYPYHYRGRDGGTQDPEAFAAAVGDATIVKMGNWYS